MGDEELSRRREDLIAQLGAAPAGDRAGEPAAGAGGDGSASGGTSQDADLASEELSVAGSAAQVAGPLP